MIETWNVTIPELTGKEARKAYLYLPDSYWEDEGRRYPVLYMFDGHNVFFDQDATYGKSWGMGAYMDATRPQAIVAAVECNHSPDHGRLKEYSPFSFLDPNLGRIAGLGKKTMDWMAFSFKREIDRNYRTLPDREHTWIGGSSMGGLMSLYALLQYNQVFGKAAALSPSLWASAPQIERMILQSEIRPGTVLYMDYGEEELRNHPGMLSNFGRASARLLEKEVLLTCRIIPGGTHCEASWEKQIPFFMNTLMYEK